jgi:hypothetical protein
MIRTLTILATLAAFAAPAAASAADIKINIVGKSAEAVEAEIAKAAYRVCRDELRGSMGVSMQAMCIDLVSDDAKSQLAAARAG